MYTLHYDGMLLHDPRSESARLVSARLSLEVNAGGKLVFEMAPGHPLFGRLAPMSAEHEVTVESDGREIFRGRVLKTQEDMTRATEIEAEGQLAYLNDTVSRPFGTYADAGDPPAWTDIAPRPAAEFAQWMVDRHNAVSDPSKRFAVTVNELTQTKLTRSSTRRSSTAADLIDGVLEPLTCYLFASFEGGRRTLEFRTEPRKAAQPIEFGRNLLDYASAREGGGVLTAIIPTGKDPDGNEFDLSSYEDGAVAERAGYSKKGDRVYSEAGYAAYGIIEATRSYEAESVAGMVRQACDELAESVMLLESVEVSAVDLNLADPSVMPWRLGDHIRVVSRPHGVNQWMMLTQCTLDICEPTKSTYKLGDTAASMSASNVLRTRSFAADVAEVATAVAPLPDATRDAAARADEAHAAAEAALDAGTLAITSTHGLLFKNGSESTVLQVAVFPNGGGRLDTMDEVRGRFGAGARIEWRWRHEGGEWGTLLSTDPHISHEGMWLTVSPEDVAAKTSFEASLVIP